MGEWPCYDLHLRRRIPGQTLSSPRYLVLRIGRHRGGRQKAPGQARRRRRGSGRLWLSPSTGSRFVFLVTSIRPTKGAGSKEGIGSGAEGRCYDQKSGRWRRCWLRRWLLRRRRRCRFEGARTRTRQCVSLNSLTTVLPHNVRDGLETFHKSFHCGWKLLGPA